MTTINVALVVETPRVPPTTIKEVAAAVQRQITRDFAPVWSVNATVDPFISLRDVPPGYWPVVVRDDLPGMDVIGIHLDDKGQPFALVKYSRTWSLTVSHEVLEMIVDPWGNRLTPGGSPLPGQGLVELLVEVCDPSGDVEHAYTVNGHLVSDFVMPSYYEPLAVPGARYSFTGAITRPRDIATGGIPLLARADDERVVVVGMDHRAEAAVPAARALLRSQQAPAAADRRAVDQHAALHRSPRRPSQGGVGGATPGQLAGRVPVRCGSARGSDTAHHRLVGDAGATTRGDHSGR